MSGMQPRRTHVKWKEVEEEIPSVYLTDDDHRPHIVRNARSAVFASRKPTRRACFLIRYATVHALSPTPIPPPCTPLHPLPLPFFLFPSFAYFSDRFRFVHVQISFPFLSFLFPFVSYPSVFLASSSSSSSITSIHRYIRDRTKSESSSISGKGKAHEGTYLLVRTR